MILGGKRRSSTDRRRQQRKDPGHNNGQVLGTILLGCGRVRQRRRGQRPRRCASWACCRDASSAPRDDERRATVAILRGGQRPSHIRSAKGRQPCAHAGKLLSRILKRCHAPGPWPAPRGSATSGSHHFNQPGRCRQHPPGVRMERDVPASASNSWQSESHEHQRRAHADPRAQTAGGRADRPGGRGWTSPFPSRCGISVG